MESASLDEHTGEERTQLKRVIGPRVLTIFIVGDILGAGIYGPRPAAWWPWAPCCGS